MAESFRYPIKYIGPQDDYFKIQVIKYTAPGFSVAEDGFGLRTTEDSLRASGSISQSLATVILPMPQNIQDNNAADWTTGTMNPVTANLGAAASSAITAENGGKDILNRVRTMASGLGNILTTGEGQQAFAAGMATLAAKALIGQGDANQAISRAAGVVFNQNVELLFNGVSMRPAYGFTFDMVPRSKSESEMIKKIIRLFKSNMTAKKGKPEYSGGGLFVGAPNVFKLEYMSGGKAHPFLHRFKPCALTQMSVNYNGSGQYASYSDATPVHMQLSLQFQELSPIYAEEYENTEDGRTGVGY